MRVRKDVESGMLVSKRRGWIVPVSSRDPAPIGTYEPGYHNKMVLLDGTHVEVRVPCGLIYHGQAHVKVATPRESEPFPIGVTRHSARKGDLVEVEMFGGCGSEWR